MIIRSIKMFFKDCLQPFRSPKNIDPPINIDDSVYSEISSESINNSVRNSPESSISKFDTHQTPSTASLSPKQKEHNNKSKMSVESKDRNKKYNDILPPNKNIIKNSQISINDSSASDSFARDVRAHQPFLNNISDYSLDHNNIISTYSNVHMKKKDKKFNQDLCNKMYKYYKER
ncbi:hypothetical protein SLOPH_494 [Spraguea lophii 42_110]|uniref:Uncharacterized protein n=1 Tax=Spraguea lophii (strain 42_110) TaxID=1358809 RepID=S7XQN9_SPRLO|nr:hypothetical protein SLOPH_494 [Spraguea lophii 42_110]